MSILTENIKQNCYRSQLLLAYDLDVELKDRVRTSRIAEGISQSELARLCGVKPSAINHLESGRTKSLSGSLLVRMASVLKVSAQWLETDVGDSQYTRSNNVPPQQLPLTPEQLMTALAEHYATAPAYDAKFAPAQLEHEINKRRSDSVPDPQHLPKQSVSR